MTKSILKGEANNNSKEGGSSHSLGPGSAPVSVVVDVVTHDEPSVSMSGSAMSNGGLTQHDNSVSQSHLGILKKTYYCTFQKKLEASRNRLGAENTSVSSYNLGESFKNIDGDSRSDSIKIKVGVVITVKYVRGGRTSHGSQEMRESHEA